MHNRLLFFLLFFLLLQRLEAVNGINALIGDESFYKTYGTAPLPGTSEKLRIQTHLAYVEALLRKAPVQQLGQQQRENRARLLDALHRYRLAGIFPENKKFPGTHRPCFIDGHGRICAVGYLVEQSVGRALAEKINAGFQYALLAEMNLPELDEWISRSGLTAAECALIQPAYGGQTGASAAIGNDSLISRIGRLDFPATADSCTLQFEVTYRGKFRHARTLSGNRQAGRKIRRRLRKQKFVPASSWSWNVQPVRYRRFLGIRYKTKDSRYSSIVRLRFVFSGPVQKDSTDNTTKPLLLDAPLDFTGIINDPRSGESIPFAVVLLENPANGQVLAGCSTDLDGKYRIRMPQGTLLPPELRLHVRLIGYADKTVSLRPLPGGVIRTAVEMTEAQYCSELNCLGIIYIRR